MRNMSSALRKRAFNYVADEIGTAKNYRAMNNVISAARCAKSAQEFDAMVGTCVAEVTEDYLSRK